MSANDKKGRSMFGKKNENDVTAGGQGSHAASSADLEARGAAVPGSSGAGSVPPGPATSAMGVVARHDDLGGEPLLALRDVDVKFATEFGEVHAVKGVTFDVKPGEVVALVGESGSGKTTTARMLLKLIEPTSGEISFEGKDVLALKGEGLKDFRQRVQAVFQDPFSSLNPSFTVGRIIEEPLQTYRRGNARQRRARVLELMDQVALPSHFHRRYPAELSGGQRQRVAIARALALNPELIVCDEPVSALDVLVQDQILTLLRRLQDELGLSYLFISHDLAVVRLISDYVCVMKDGQVVEAASSEEVFTNPRHPYTRRLLASIPGNELGIAVEADGTHV